jgi:hypothetical protein
MNAHERLPEERDKKLAAQLELFTTRAVQIFEGVEAGRILMVDGADLLHDAAEASGLIAAIGEDNLQRLLAACFANATQDPKIGENN